jgi:hypothetical protein
MLQADEDDDDEGEAGEDDADSDEVGITIMRVVEWMMLLRETQMACGTVTVCCVSSSLI